MENQITKGWKSTLLCIFFRKNQCGVIFLAWIYSYVKISCQTQNLFLISLHKKFFQFLKSWKLVKSRCVAKIQFLTGLQPDFHHFLLIGSVSKVGLKRGHFYKRVRVELAFLQQAPLNKQKLNLSVEWWTKAHQKAHEKLDNMAVFLSLYLQQLGSYKSANSFND